MKTLIKQIIKPIYYTFSNRNLRQFNTLYDKIDNYKRNEEIAKVKFLDYTFKVPDYKSFVWQYKEIFCDQIYRLSLNSKKLVIIDCGSNIGMSLLYFAKMHPEAKIIGFEPDKKLAKIISENLSNNSIYNVEIINKAVWINSDGINFNADGADGGRVSVTGVNEIVETVNLKEILKNEAVIDFLKMDIEGAECKVMVHCKDDLKNVRNIFIEYHSFSSHSQELHTILETLTIAGFRYYLQNEQIRDMPFFNKGLEHEMDMQINIFGYR